MFFYVTVLFLATVIDRSGSTSSTLSFIPSTNTTLRRLAVDPLTGMVYVGAVNHVYQLDSNLTLEVDESTGPEQDDKNCADFDSAGQLACQPPHLRSTDNYNQVTFSFHWLSLTCYISRLYYYAEYFFWCHSNDNSNDNNEKMCQLGCIATWGCPTPRQSSFALITTPMPSLKSLNLSAAVL